MGEVEEDTWRVQSGLSTDVQKDISWEQKWGEI